MKRLLFIVLLLFAFSGLGSTVLFENTVSVNADSLFETDEGHKVTLSNPINGTIAQSSAAGSILNDDMNQPPPPPDAGWTELQDTKLREVCPPKNFGWEDYNFHFYCKNVLSAWSSAVVNPNNNTLIIWGGGHNSYYGNEVYELDIANGVMSRVTDPAIPLGIRKQRIAESELTPYDGTQPNGRSTYDGLAFIPNANRMWAFSGSLSSRNGGADNVTWEYNPDSKTWKRLDPAGTIPGGALGIVSAYDPNSGKVFIHDRRGLYSYEWNENGGIYTRLTGGEGQLPYGLSGVIDPVRNKFIMIGLNRRYVYDLNNPAKASFETSGDTAIEARQAPGLAYDPIADRIVGWVGQSKLYYLDLDTYEWTSEAFSGGPSFYQIPQGTYGRFDYVPDLDSFILVNKYDQNAFIFKPFIGTNDNNALNPPITSLQEVHPYKAVLKWSESDDPAGIIAYRVYRNGVEVARTTSLKYVDFDVNKNTQYLYTVKAEDAFGNLSANSNVLTVDVPDYIALVPQGDCSNESFPNRTDVVMCEPWESDTWYENGYSRNTSLTRDTPVSSVGNLTIVNTDCVSGSCLKVPMLKGYTGSVSVAWKLKNADIEPEQLFLRYYLKLADDWDALSCSSDGTLYSHGGKFPGIADVRAWPDPSGQCGNGGNRSDGINCWSMRSGYRSCGYPICDGVANSITRFGSYVYHPFQSNSTGTTADWDAGHNDTNPIGFRACDLDPKNLRCGIDTNGVLVRDRWYEIEMQVTMNTPGIPDGIIRGWVDGKLAYQKTNVMFRLEGHDNLHNRLVWLNVYKGGTRGNCVDSAIYLDQMVVSTANTTGIR